MTQNKDYQDFLSSETEVPSELTQIVQMNIFKLLNPSPWVTFTKLLGIHIIVGILSLSVCHQFEINPFNTSFSLSDWFMNMGGHAFCMVACGFVFIVGTIFAAGYFFTIEELKALKKNEFIQTLSLGLISLSLLLAVGAKIALGIALLWLFGGILGGFIATQAVLKIKIA